MTQVTAGMWRVRSVVRLFLLGGAAMSVAHAASAANWYVDGRYGKQSNPGSASAPFLYFWQGTQVAKPGDTVYVLPTTTYPHMSISVSGTSGKPITIAGAGIGPNLTRVVGDPSNFAMWVNANYVTVQNFDFSAPGLESGLHISENHHHVTIAGNVVHDSGGNGISTIGDDYLTISHNIVYGNARNTSNNAFGSGISLLGSVDIDGVTDVKMRIDGNVVYGNTNTPNCSLASCLNTATDSDGNGIIVDDSRRSTRDRIPYHGRTLITNNVVFGNGGRGVHVYLSDHVTVTNNTVFSNNQDPYEGNYHPGEVEALYSGDVAVYDNILYSDGGVGIGGGRNTGTHVPLNFANCSGGGQLIARYNLAYSPQNNQVIYFGKNNDIPVTVDSNAWGDPLFVRASLDPLVANFTLRAGSPAAGAANIATSAATTMTGASRAVFDSIGAY